MRIPWTLGCVFVALIVGNATAGVSGKLGTISITTKKGDYPVFSYSYQIETTEKRIKRPHLSFYLLVEHPDTTRSTHYAGYGPYNWDQAKESVREPEVEAVTVKWVRSKTVGSPFVSSYVFAERDKILVYRVELWQDGVLLDTYMSKSEADLTTLGIPPEWYRKKL